MTVDEQDQITTRGIVNQFNEGIGMLVQQGLVDVNLVNNLLSSRIIWFWETFSDNLIRERERLQDPT